MLTASFLIVVGSFGSIDANLTQPKAHSKYHSNLGEQKIVEDLKVNDWIGITPDQIDPNIAPLGSLREFSIRKKKNSEGKEIVRIPPKVESQAQKTRRFKNWIGSTPLQIQPGIMPLGRASNFRFEYQEQLKMNLSLYASSRPYWTNNALRLSDNELSSMIWENSVGGSLEAEPIVQNDYLSLIPSLDLNLQFADYQEELFSDLLSYRYASVRMGMRMELPRDFTAGFGLDYNILHGLEEGNKMFDAITPSVSVSKVFTVNEQTFFFASSSLRYAFTDRIINFHAEGVFPDDGDNLQMNLGLSLVKLFGENGDFRLMPSIGCTLSRYLKNEQKGRLDVVPYLSVSLGWQPIEWFGIELSGTFSGLSTNSKGRTLLGSSSRYRAMEGGLSLSAYKLF